MKTLLELYTDLDEEIWDYYKSVDPHTNLNNPFSAGNNLIDHKNFIKNYFGCSGKREILNDFKQYFPNDNERSIHTNSVFFFGILLRENTILKKKLFNDARSQRDYPLFPFIWFLSILFHDHAMGIEDNSKDYLNQIKSIQDVYKVFDIKYKLFELKNIASNQFSELISNYFHHRRYSSKKIDHGILAGIYFYDRLVKIRKKKAKVADSELNWNVSLEKHYCLAATAIACHNIWTVAKMSSYEADYIKFELHDLIVPDFKEISINNFPLLFLFGLVDSIDPIKIYTREGHKPDEILNKIQIEFSENSFTLKNKIDSNLNFQTIVRAASGLCGWLAVNITHSPSNELLIEFKIT
ncbi:hypothetical protein [Flavobacterium sp. Root420]|uniref:hypothetical protein n=1 Tax=Flavobacterium sp. Root420 TaxID=1736533 RepID=UPI0007005AD8|nr:hypothetical protein [Flavobacterium sp. Root420]KQX00748.1 hypothetical protein ASC72_07735 [Flavobacterium sp. Root420]